jgi:translation elongation factor EF-1beta
MKITFKSNFIELDDFLNEMLSDTDELEQLLIEKQVEKDEVVEFIFQHWVGYSIDEFFIQAIINNDDELEVDNYINKMKNIDELKMLVLINKEEGEDEMIFDNETVNEWFYSITNLFHFRPNEYPNLIEN